MMAEFHFLRPWWLLALFLLAGLAALLVKQLPKSQSWGAICDSHLLAYLVEKSLKHSSLFSLTLPFLSALFMIISLAGPTWHQLPTPTYKTIEPKILVLSMSSNMLDKDLTPNRLSRAKFKIQDLLTHKNSGQFGLVVYTGEPFVVSPLTDDGQTIAALLPSLTPEIIPVTGDRLDFAIQEAKQLIYSAGYKKGQILVLTAHSPSKEAINTAQHLAKVGIISSILPITKDENLHPLFQSFASYGKGLLLRYSPDSNDLNRWLKAYSSQELQALNKQDYIPLWRDDGRWFLLIALFLLLPVFQRGWLERVNS